MVSPFFFRKKPDGLGLRPIQDYRKLNELTIKNQYPLLLIGELVDKLKGAKIFMKLDVWWEYNNIQIKEGDEWKAVFRTSKGLFKPTVMFFRLTNLPTTFQAMMNTLFHDLIQQGKVVIYLDNILIFMKDLAEHHIIVKEVLKIPRGNKHYLKPTKCKTEKDEIKYLGIIIGHGKVQMDPSKVDTVRNW
jgi:Reverse transcriptase (RNA-dependent DNA polymerase)